MKHIKKYFKFLIISLILYFGPTLVVQIRCQSATQDKNTAQNDLNELFIGLIGKKDIKQLEEFLAHGVAIDGVKLGNLPLWFAVQNAIYDGDTSIVQFLLARGSAVNALDSKGNSILSKFLDWLKNRFSDCDENIPAYLKKQKVTALKLIKLLLDSGANPNIPNAQGNTPLDLAIELKSPEIIQMLVDYKADVNGLNKVNYTPFSYLLTEVVNTERRFSGSNYKECKNVFFKIAEIFLKAGANLRIMDDNDVNNPVRAAAVIIEDPEWLNLVLKAGANISQQGWKGKTVLHELFSGLYFGINKLTLLFKYNAFKLLNTPDQFGVTPLTLLENSSNGALKQEVQKLLVDTLYSKKDLTMLDTATAQKIFDYILESSQSPDTLLDKKKSEALLARLSRELKLKSPNPQLITYTPEDLLRVYDVSVIDNTILDNPQDALPIVAEDKPNKTQTEAYLSKPSLREGVIANYGKKIVRLPKLIARIIEQERKYPDYQVFYHGQMRDFIVLYDVIKEIQNWFNNKANIPAFEYVRFPEGQNKKLSEYVSLGSLMDDTTPEMIKHLLSVNLSLFGSTTQWGSATFSYFLDSRNMRPPRDLLTEIFNKLNLNTAYIPQILDTLALLESPTGNMLQIFIPRDKVNDYAYLSVAFGKPLPASGKYTKLAPIAIADSQGSTHTYNPAELDVKTYLDLFRNYPEAISDEDIDLIQGRINITEDFLLNPKSGVKIYRYNTVQPEKLLEYQNKLREIVKEAMEDWKKRNTTPLSAKPAETVSHALEDLTSVITTT